MYMLCIWYVYDMYMVGIYYVKKMYLQCICNQFVMYM